jgi:hypothetical protein
LVAVVVGKGPAGIAGPGFESVAAALAESQDGDGVEFVNRFAELSERFAPEDFYLTGH